MFISLRLFFVAMAILLVTGEVGAQSKNSLGGGIDVNFYPHLLDVDSDNTLTINMASKLQHRFSLFRLINLGNEVGEEALKETEVYYTEQKLRGQIQERSSVDLTLQLNFRSGQVNDRHRLGVRWRLNQCPVSEGFFESLRLSWFINLHEIQIDNENGNVWPLEHVSRMTFPHLFDRPYLARFVDHAFHLDLPNSYPSSPIVGKSQLGLRTIKNLHFISEYRVNQYRRQDVNNLAAGFEYILSLAV